MPRGKKKAKAKSKSRTKSKIKAKRRVVAARTPMAGVLCINVPAGTACVVKRLTAEVKAAADRGDIVAITLKGHHVLLGGCGTIVAKPAKFEDFITKEDDTPVGYANGHSEAGAEAAH